MNIRRRIRRWEISLAAGLFLAALAGATLEHTSQDLADSLVRLHVIANSDDAGDQEAKLLVRDDIVAFVTPLLSQAQSRQEAEEIIGRHLQDIVEKARQSLREQGRSDEVSAALENVDFPTKKYDGFAVPAGVYDALRVVIGEGKGENWWCVVFPPLCTSTAESVTTAAAQNGMSDGQIRLITEESDTYVFSFKCLEWWGGLKAFFKSK